MKIDTSKIHGYAEMSAEEKLKALEEFEYDDVGSAAGDELAKLKAAVSKANSEAADWKKKYNARLTDEEKRQAEENAAKEAEAQKFTDLEEKYNALLKDKVIAEYTAKYLALGYDKELAEETAKAMADGDTEAVFRNSQKHQEAYAKKMKEELLNGTPKPAGAGSDGKPMTKEEIFKIKDPVERQDAIAANMGLFGGN